MQLKTVLAGSAIAALSLATDLPSVIGYPSASVAQAETSVSISLFYNDLAGHGSWIRHRDDYVFIPRGVRTGWRPYTDGHWVYVEDAGWTWVSSEPFGWATYHYGRWGYDNQIGWYWVPGTRWAPAWVSWQRSDDYVVWAPLPPRRDRDAGVSISISAGDIPDYYWVAVPTRNFLDVDLRVRLVDSDRDRDRIIRRAEFIGTPRIRNDMVVNTAIDVQVIERETGQKIKRVKARRTDNPRKARATDEEVTVFRGELRKDRDAKPDRVRNEAEVRKIKRDGGRDGGKERAGDPETGSTSAASEDGRDQTGTDTKSRKGPARAEANQPDDKQDANKDGTRNGKAAAEKRRKNPAPAKSEADDMATGSTGKAEQRKTRSQDPQKARERRAKDEPAAKSNRSNRGDAGQNKQNARQKPQRPDSQQDNSRRNKRKNTCDPSTDSNCAQP